MPSPLALALAAGGLYASAFPPWSCWPLAVCGAVLLVAALRAARTLGETLAAAVVMRVVSAAVVVSYLWRATPWIHLATVGTLVGGWLLLACAFWLLRRRAGVGAAILAVPALWTLIEWSVVGWFILPSHNPDLFTALAPGALPLAPYTGLYGVTYLGASLAAAACLALEWRPAPPRRRRRLAAGAAAAFGPALLVPAAAFLLRPAPPEAKETLSVDAAGLNPYDERERYLDHRAPDDEQRAAVKAHIERRMGQLRGLVGRGRPGLILLPEDALDFMLPGAASPAALRELGVENNGPLIEAYRALAREVGAPVVAGMTTLRGGVRRNSVLLLRADGGLGGLRDKQHLTPGSEYWPLARWGIPLWVVFPGNDLVGPDRQYSPGKGPLEPLSVGGWPLGVMVCIEGQMPSVYRAWKKAGAQALLLLANARWFRGDPSGYNGQVLNIARLAARAYGLPVVMTGKTGFVGLVDSGGRLDIRPSFGPDFVEGFRRVELKAGATETFPSRRGEYFLLLSALVLLIAPALAREPGFRR